jgi:hypothetical protein
VADFEQARATKSAYSRLMISVKKETDSLKSHGFSILGLALHYIGNPEELFMINIVIYYSEKYQSKPISYSITELVLDPDLF